MKILPGLCTVITLFFPVWSVKSEVAASRVTSRDATGTNTLCWTFSPETFANQPSWAPLRQEIPLSPQAAVLAGVKWLQNKGQATNDLRVTSIDLRPQDESKWLYWIHFTSRSPVYNTALVMLDGTVLEPSAVSTNAAPPHVPSHAPFVREMIPATNAVIPSMAGMKGSYETIEAKVLKAFVVDDDGAKFRAYLVKWKDNDVIVSDPLSKTNKKEGDTITFMANRHELTGGNKLLSFHLMEFGPPKTANPIPETPINP